MPMTRWLGDAGHVMSCDLQEIEECHVPLRHVLELVPADLQTQIGGEYIQG